MKLSALRWTLLFPILLLAACSTVVEHARIETTADLKSSIQLLLREPFKPEAPEKARQTLEKYQRQAEGCGARARIFQGSGSGSSSTFGLVPSAPLFLQINTEFLTRDELDVLARCGDLPRQELRVLNVYKESGLLATTYHLEFELATKLNPREPENTLPREFSVTMPAPITDISDNSSLPTHRVRTQQIGDNKVTITLQWLGDQALEQWQTYLTQAICASCQQATPGYVCGSEKTCDLEPATIDEISKLKVRFHIQAQDAQFDLPLIISILGLLFGSGLVYEIFRHLRKRRQSD